MSELLTTLGGRIVDAGVAAAIVSGLTVLAMLTTRQPTRRRAIARAGVLGALLTLPLVYFRPFGPWDLLTPVRSAIGPTLDWISDRLGVRPEIVPGSWLNAMSPWLRTALSVLMGAYACGVVANLGRLTLGWWGTKWIGRNSIAPGREIAELYADLPFPAGRSRPRLRVSSRTTRPVLLGMFRQTILIPPDLAEHAAAAPLRLSLLHELAHAEASDPWFGLASELAAVFWFPLPPLWWIRRQMRLDQEYLADRQASAQLRGSRDYASSLVAIAASPVRSRSNEATGIRSTPTRVSSLFLRVMMLVRCPFPVESRPPRWWRWSMVGVGLVVLSLATRVSIRARAVPFPPDLGASPRVFALPKLIVDERADADGPTPLPIRLPADFRLTFEVFARQSDLANIRILEHPLSASRIEPDRLLTMPPQWHRLTLTRSGGRLQITLDSSPTRLLDGPSLDEWLTIRTPPGRATTFRALNLSW